MECKSYKHIFDYVHLLELIETLWNVNQADILIQLCICHELIETLWNVNMRCTCYTAMHHIELIETLWNVNFRASQVRNVLM